MKRFFILGVFVVIAGISLVFARRTCPLENSRVCFRETCFNVELAQTDRQKEVGLQERAHLAENAGMLFIFDTEAVYGFWMKKTLIPLDMIWIDAQKKIVSITHNAPPCREDFCPTYTPSKPVRYVLELNGGIAQQMGLNEGDTAEFDRIF